MTFRTRVTFGLSALTAIALAAACTTEETPGTGGGGEAGASGGAGGSAGKGGTAGKGGSSTGGTAGKGSTATGGGAGESTGGTGASGESGSGAGGLGGEGGDKGEVSCVDAEVLPQTIDEDLSVGPGCVRINRSVIAEGAILTIAPGTTVLMAPAGFLDAADNSALVAVGTEAEPILFTSESANPSPGDWQCVRIGGASSGSEIEHARFEYGGAACASTGADYEGMLQINADARSVSNSTFEHSLTHGVLIQPDGGVRKFENNTFGGNEEPSLEVSVRQLLALGEGLTFEDADDRIDIDTDYSLDSSGTLLGQPVPFHVTGNLAFAGNAEVTIAAGARFEFAGSSFSLFTANLVVEGTEANPVVFTSAQASPQAGDWGCVVFESSTAVPRFDHMLIEYAGNGQGCTGGEYEAGLVVPDTAVIEHSTFSNIAGVAIKTAGECDTDWCSNTFEDIAVGPLGCDIPEVPTSCP